MKWTKVVMLITVLGLLVMTSCKDNQPVPEPSASPTEEVAPTATATVVPQATVTEVPQATATGIPTAVPTGTPSPEPTITPTKGPVEEITRIPYVDENVGLRKLNVYLPSNFEKPFPTILAIRSTEHSNKYMETQANYLALRGYATVVIGIRQAPNYPFPADIEDGSCALAWTHANASTYGFDPERIFVMGSMGAGSTAGILGTMDDPSEYLVDCPYTMPGTNWVRGSMMICGYWDWTHDTLIELPEAVVRFDATYEENPDAWAASSPMTRADINDPPVLWICGELAESCLSYQWENILTELFRDMEKQISETGINTTVSYVDETFCDTFNREQTFKVMEDFIKQNHD